MSIFYDIKNKGKKKEKELIELLNNINKDKQKTY